MSTAASEAAADDGSQLVTSAASWIDEAMAAWADDNYRKVAALAPLAVELLGKAVLWRTNPVLLVPLTQDAEESLLILATKPGLAAPKLRTVGMAVLLGRLERLLGSLPINPPRRRRLIETRNGAMHVGSATSSRHVLLDALVLCQVMLRHLGEDERAFFGPHQSSVAGLLDEKRTEVGHAVAAKRARARRHLTELEQRLGRELFEETTAALEARAPLELDASDYGEGLEGADISCPECTSDARLFGRLDVDVDVDFDVEPIGGGQYDSFAHSIVILTLAPAAFACHVCGLQLTSVDELGEAGLPRSPYKVEEADLGPSFDINFYLYGYPDDE